MIKYISILFCFTFFCCQSCKEQNRENLSTVEPNNDAVRYASVQNLMPYSFERGDMYTSLPDSLGGDEIKGFAVLEAIIDEKAHINEVNIMKISVSQKDSASVVDYYYGKNDSYDKTTYPEEVKRYYPFLKNYLNSLKIKMNPGVAPDKRNKLVIMVRFK